MFSEDDPFVGIDLDDCRNPETSSIDDDARDIVNQLDSYTEISPSGTGFHVLIEGELPEGGNRHGSVEMYESARFFTMTGDRVDAKPPSVNERQETLTMIHRKHVQEPSMCGGQSEETIAPSVTHAVEVDLSNERLIERAHNAANGEKFERLWQGKTAGYSSHSEADMALCCLLAFWTEGESQRIDELFRQSELMCPKWDEIHYADNTTYGERTIERAIENTSDYYEPPGGSENNSPGAAG